MEVTNMEYRVLGKTGLKISRLGFGGIPIQRIDAEGTRVLVHQLKDAGILCSAVPSITDEYIVCTFHMQDT